MLPLQQADRRIEDFLIRTDRLSERFLPSDGLEVLVPYLNRHSSGIEFAFPKPESYLFDQMDQLSSDRAPIRNIATECVFR